MPKPLQTHKRVFILLLTPSITGHGAWTLEDRTHNQMRARAGRCKHIWVRVVPRAMPCDGTHAMLIRYRPMLYLSRSPNPTPTVLSASACHSPLTPYGTVYRLSRWTQH